MVNSESEVVPSPLPSPIFYNSDLQVDASSDSDIEPVVLGARPSRAFFDGGGAFSAGTHRGAGRRRGGRGREAGGQ